MQNQGLSLLKKTMNYKVLIVTCGPVAALFEERYSKMIQRSEHRKDRQLLGLFPNFFHMLNSKKSPEERKNEKVILPRAAKDTEGRKFYKNLKRSRFVEEQAPGQPGSSRY
jgi:hypothetical protein